MLLYSLAFVVFAVNPGRTTSDSSPTPIEFSRDVRPILSKYCYQCHGPDDKARKGDLRLDLVEGATRKLPSGNQAIVPEKPEQSELLSRISSKDLNEVMPPPEVGKKLTLIEIATLRRWIEQDAKYSNHWAYTAPVHHPAPAVSLPTWPRNAIDHFILARLDREGLKPSPPVDNYALLRRVALDLTGLPPSAEEVERFIDDPSPDSYERAVDRLLAKPTFGERWASMWLDLARYADSSGYIHDPPRTIWRWRDWLVQALNENVPYDRFTTDMLAGDLLPSPTVDQLIATGFHRNTTTNSEGGANASEYHFAAVVDRVNTTMQVWMGTTMACAQCHNHKYDPFTQKEYYQLFAILNNTVDFNGEPPTLEVPRVGFQSQFLDLAPQWKEASRRLEEETRRVDALRTEWEKTVDPAQLPKEIGEILAVAADKRTPAQVEKLTAHYRVLHEDWKTKDADAKRLRGALDQVAATTLIQKEGSLRPTYVAIRGEFQNHGEAVSAGFPAALHAAPAGLKLDRVGLATWLMDRQNPLTARVAVNRQWQELFGIGIVETSEEFGIQGEPPSHPELLDWLATEFMRLDWDTKRLLRLIVVSTAYRQTSSTSSELAERDPHNRLLARGSRTRLSAEALRDQALEVSGLLSPKMYGPPAHPFQPVNGLAAAFGQSTDWQTSQGEDSHRRAIYTRWRRNLPYPSMIAFDVPERTVCSTRRIRTNTPIQALVTLNDPVFVEAAQSLARRTQIEGGATPELRARFAVQIVLARKATDAEVARLVKLFQDSKTSLAANPTRAAALATKPLGPLPAGMDAVDAAAWTVVGNVLLNLDETLTKR
ncbi:MAG: PSD1 domain-containing protein [Planctomycetaceae bacterium]|nr:PSD1 domain-containing protein [Planctomycetaceae bacterium]